MSGFLGVYLECAALKVFEAEADFREFQASEVRGKSGERRGGNEQITFSPRSRVLCRSRSAVSHRHFEITCAAGEVTKVAESFCFLLACPQYTHPEPAQSTLPGAFADATHARRAMATLAKINA